MSQVEDKTAGLLVKLWEKNRPIVEQRLEMLERASAAAASGGLNEELRREGARAAHNLAGSLGMYGYEDGTRIAREIDALLSNELPGAAKLASLIAELRAAVFPEGSPASD
ncbi:MAG TPA: Hpt domain-containing protein [Acidobacteriaceae bacterium]|nr:Hpt domain-containing protein [Acidobacteriaceae bacterium]